MVLNPSDAAARVDITLFGEDVVNMYDPALEHGAAHETLGLGRQGPKCLQHPKSLGIEVVVSDQGDDLAVVTKDEPVRSFAQPDSALEDRVEYGLDVPRDPLIACRMSLVAPMSLCLRRASLILSSSVSFGLVRPGVTRRTASITVVARDDDAGDHAGHNDS
jgi:hypothetical protein